MSDYDFLGRTGGENSLIRPDACLKPTRFSGWEHSLTIYSINYDGSIGHAILLGSF